MNEPNPGQDISPLSTEETVQNSHEAAPESIAPACAPAVPRQRTRPIEAVIVSIGLAILAGVIALIVAIVVLASSFQSLFTPAPRNNTPPDNTFAIINVIGTIQNASGGAFGMNEPSYNHGATINFIRQLADNPGNKGILLYMNTGGGGVYESDEVYRELMAYREKTGRPIWAFMGQTCASGGYYISMAAEKLVASYNTTTGSIGVYLALTDTSGLYDKLGIRTVLIRTGDKKGVGTNGVPITEEQSAVYQSIVDENFDRFVELVALGRGMTEAEVRKLADGRPYTANQAIANGLIDELGAWEATRDAFKELTGAESFTPNFSYRTPIGSLLGEISNMLPRADTDAQLALADELPVGVPLAWAPGLW